MEGTSRDRRVDAGGDALAKADRLANEQGDAVLSAFILAGSRTPTHGEWTVDFAVLRAAWRSTFEAAALERTAPGTRQRTHAEATA